MTKPILTWKSSFTHIVLFCVVFGLTQFFVDLFDGLSTTNMYSYSLVVGDKCWYNMFQFRVFPFSLTSLVLNTIRTSDCLILFLESMVKFHNIDKNMWLYWTCTSSFRAQRKRVWFSLNSYYPGLSRSWVWMNGQDDLRSDDYKDENNMCILFILYRRTTNN